MSGRREVYRRPCIPGIPYTATMQMKSIDYDYKIYIDVEWFDPFMYEHEKIVEHVCKRSKGTDTHSEVKLKIRGDMSSIMNS